MQVLAGTISPSIDFIDEFYVPLSYNNSSTQGTSFTAPKVAGVVSEMMTIDPGLSPAQVFQKLNETADNSGRIYYPNNLNKYDTNRKIVNPARAKAGAVDPFWKRYIEQLKDVLNTMKFGWNYGSSQHDNGALVRFKTFPLNSLSPSNSLEPDGVAQASQSVLLFSFNPFDIDTSNEVQVLVNDKSYGKAIM